MIDNMNTLKRLTDAIQWDVSPKKRTIPTEDILEGKVVRLDMGGRTVVGIGPVVFDMVEGRIIGCVKDDGTITNVITPAKDIAHACVPIAPLKKWLAAFTGDAVHIHLKGGLVLIRGEIGDYEVGGLVAERIDQEAYDEEVDE